MLPLKDWQRRVLLEKVLDIAYVAAGAMVFGQFLSDRPFSLTLAAFGIVTWALLAGCALKLGGSEQ